VGLESLYQANQQGTYDLDVEDLLGFHSKVQKSVKVRLLAERTRTEGTQPTAGNEAGIEEPNIHHTTLGFELNIVKHLISSCGEEAPMPPGKDKRSTGPKNRVPTLMGQHNKDRKGKKKKKINTGKYLI
jgi:hypothetical protein